MNFDRKVLCLTVYEIVHNRNKNRTGSTGPVQSRSNAVVISSFVFLLLLLLILLAFLYSMLCKN